MALTLTQDFSTKTGTIVASDFDDNFTDIQNKFNGNIVNADISTSAAIAVSKLAASKQHMFVTLSVKALASGWPGSTTLVDHAPIPGSVAQGNWTVEGVDWVCSDTGDGAGVFSVRWGDYDSSGAWVNTSTIVTTQTMSNAAAANDANHGECTVSGSTLTVSDSTPRMLALMGTTASASTLSAETSNLAVTVHLSRTITA